MGEGSSEQGGRDSNVLMADSSGTIPGTIKDQEKCEGTLGSREGTEEDNPNDPYGPWVVVARRRGGKKATKKEVPTDHNPVKIMGSSKGGDSDNLRREGKRKVSVGLEGKRKDSVGLMPNGAQMQHVVHQIVPGPKSLSQRPPKERFVPGSSGTIFSPSVKGKKEIARNRASLILSKGGKGSSTKLKESSSFERNQFVESRGSNADQIFTFQSVMGGAQQRASCYMGEEIQVVQSPQGYERSKEERQNGGSASMTGSGSESEDSKEEPAAVEVPNTDFLQREGRDGPGKGGGVADQMEFEDSGGVANPI